LHARTHARRYLMQQKPVVFRNAMVDVDHFGLRRRWSRGNLLALYGDVVVDVGEVPFAKQMGIRGARTATLRLRNWVNSWYDDDHNDGGGNAVRADDDILAEIAAAAAAAAAKPYGGVVMGNSNKKVKQQERQQREARTAEATAPQPGGGGDGDDDDGDGNVPLYLFSSRILEDSGLLADTKPMQRHALACLLARVIARSLPDCVRGEKK
jgi:hypothetical protein